MDAWVDESHRVVKVKLGHVWQTSYEVHQGQDGDEVPCPAFIVDISGVHDKDNGITEHSKR